MRRAEALLPCGHRLRRAFFFSGSDGPRELHSFPTRRSSDLVMPRVREARELLLPAQALEDDGRLRRHLRALGRGEAVRSEEHTSELQSLTNLVCRLLLEKKKEADGE